MTNPEAAPSLYLLKSSSSWTILLLLLLFAILLPTAYSESETTLQWQILTKLNFSSQIRLHPNILVIVTVPWCGESRSLMKELSHSINKKHHGDISLKLMLVYQNTERILADALGASEGTTILYYHHSLRYRYQGRLRAQNILSSANYLLSFSPEEIPLKSLHTPGDLKAFLESADKTLLLLEFCGWTPRLLAKGKNDTFENLFGFNGERNDTLTSKGKKNQKGIESEKISCGIDDGFEMISSFGGFTPVNKSDPPDAENMRSNGGVSCNFEEFQRFESMLLNFETVVRDFFLPPERLRFALVPERSMLSFLGVGESTSSWSMMLYFAGCPNCSKVLQEADDLKSVLQIQASPVIELKGDEHDVEAALPENKPSVLLFIDRSSDSLEIRRKSKEALEYFRESALHNQITSKTMNEENTANPQKSPFEAYQASRPPGLPRLEQSPVYQKISKLKDTMSITIVNDGKHVSLDTVASGLQGSSLNEILNYVLHHKKGIKLSSLAKDAGFQLLSDDFDIKIAETAQLQTENTVSAELPTEDLVGRVDVKKDDIPNLSGTSDREHEELVIPMDTVHSRYKDEKTCIDNISDDFDIKTAETAQLQTENTFSVELPTEDLVGSVDIKKGEMPNLIGTDDREHEELVTPTGTGPSHYKDDREHEELVTPTDTGPSRYKDEKTNVNKVYQLSLVPDDDYGVADARTAEGTLEMKTLSVGNGKGQLQYPGFRVNFFFSDGNFRLLKALTSVEKIPSLVIVDPLSQQHYVLPEEAELSYSTLSYFLGSFLNGTLLPYERSESVTPLPRGVQSPPFVNMDFHAVDSIPRVTGHTFFQLVVGNKSDSIDDGNAWKKDVLVLFTVSWCGFCQRMELVVREVYRAFKGYANLQTRNEKSILSSDDVPNDVKAAILKLPLIYLMDCTLNDCSLILKSRIQRELYPSLLLFPAERKNAVPYGGDMTVSKVIKFIADHGSNSHWIFKENGILWTDAKQGSSNFDLYKDELQPEIHDEASPLEDKYHEVLLKDRNPKPDIRNNQIIPRKQKDSQKTTPEVVVGTIIIANDKLLYAPPFDKSEILIFTANQSLGFQGLIINKPISWDSLQELEKGLEFLKEAPLSLGGPVIIRGMPLVALTRNSVEDQDFEILPGIYFLNQWATIKVIKGIKEGNQTVSDYWFFVGYSNWGWDQLFDEIAEGDWEISDGKTKELKWRSR